MTAVEVNWPPGRGLTVREARVLSRLRARTGLTWTLMSAAPVVASELVGMKARWAQVKAREKQERKIAKYFSPNRFLTVCACM